MRSCSPALFSPRQRTVPRTKSCSGRFYPVWLDNSIVRKYIYYHNVNFRHEMWTNLVHAHCFSLVFFNEKLFENATIGLSDVYRWMVRRNFQASHQLSPFLDHRSIIDPWSSNPTLLGTFTFDFSIPIIPYGLDLIHDCCLLLLF